MKRFLDDEEKHVFEELLRATKRVRALVSELLSTDAHHRQSACDHSWGRVYAEGVRDNGGYDVVCRRCGMRA